MFVLFDPLYRARAAALVPTAVVREHASHAQFTASDRVFANDAMLAYGEDWTDSLRRAALRDQRREAQSGGFARLDSAARRRHETGVTPSAPSQAWDGNQGS
jgi:hypothetical protein